MFGDGNCDDIMNYSQCGFDGGDCCLVLKNTDFCTNCQCKTPGKKISSCYCWGNVIPFRKNANAGKFILSY